MENKELLRSVRRVRNVSEYFHAEALLFIAPCRVPRQVLNLKLYEICKNFIKFRSVNGRKFSRGYVSDMTFVRKQLFTQRYSDGNIYKVVSFKNISRDYLLKLFF